MELNNNASKRPHAEGYKFNEYFIPKRMMPGIYNYIMHGQLPGAFLCAVIRGDLFEAVGRADEENVKNLLAYCAYFYNEAPSGCYGSNYKMQAWVAKKEEKWSKQNKEIPDATL